MVTDIVIPGIYVALMLRYDVFAHIKRHPYFTCTMLSYVVGMGCTIGVMLAFNAAQPALLYLVPAILLASLGVAAARGEIPTLWAWSEVRTLPTNMCWGSQARQPYPQDEGPSSSSKAVESKKAQ